MELCRAVARGVDASGVGDGDGERIASGVAGGLWGQFQFRFQYQEVAGFGDTVGREMDGEVMPARRDICRNAEVVVDRLGLARGRLEGYGVGQSQCGTEISAGTLMGTVAVFIVSTDMAIESRAR